MHRPSLIIRPIVDQDLDVLSDEEECMKKNVQVVVEMSSKSLKKKKKNLQHHCERERNLGFFSAGNYFWYFGYKNSRLLSPLLGLFSLAHDLVLISG